MTETLLVAAQQEKQTRSGRERTGPEETYRLLVSARTFLQHKELKLKRGHLPSRAPVHQNRRQSSARPHRFQALGPGPRHSVSGPQLTARTVTGSVGLRSRSDCCCQRSAQARGRGGCGCACAYQLLLRNKDRLVTGWPAERQSGIKFR